ncbi:MAG: Cu/Ag efflux protein CusF [Oceanospirillaceae bacterium]|jgi:Cu/Ag efflux protein CusF
MYAFVKRCFLLVTFIVALPLAALAHGEDKHGMTAVTTGVIKSVLTQAKQLKIQHQMIPEWNMQAMQMKFNLAPTIKIENFKAGQTIKFRMQHKNMMKFTVLEIL